MEPGDGREMSTRGEGGPSVSWESNTYHLSLREDKLGKGVGQAQG